MANAHEERPGETHDAATGMMLMMGWMMGLCFGTVLLFSLIPIIGLPVAVALALVGVAAMLYLHRRLMGQGRR